jgi:hypothetical protein
MQKTPLTDKLADPHKKFCRGFAGCTWASRLYRACSKLHGITEQAVI